MKEACREFVADPTYLARLKVRLIAGKLAPAMECMLWHFAYGKPSEEHEHKHTVDLADIIAGNFREGE